MVFDSKYWKLELYKNAQILSKSIHLKRLKNESFVKIEKACMISSYIVRKLNEAKKIPPDYLNNEIDAIKYKKKCGSIDFMTWHNIHIKYDFRKRNKIRIKWSYLINQLIHSFVFIVGMGENNIDMFILFNSDNSQEKELNSITVLDFVKILLMISEGEIQSCEMRRVDGKMTLICADYIYPPSFDVNSVINNIRYGNFYKRK